MTNTPRNELTRDEAGLLLMCTPKWIEKLARDGVFARSGRGRYGLVEIVQGYVRHLRAQIDAKASGAGNAADRLRDARAREIDLRSAERDRRVIDLAEATETVDAIIGICLESFEGLPARITRNPRERTRITAIIDAERQRVAARFAEIARAVATGDRSGDGAQGDDV